MDPFFEIEFHRPAKGSKQSSRGVYQQLKDAIAAGRLPSGSKLPPTRAATRIFGVSRNTVAEAYERLQNDGHIRTRRGSGTYVAEKAASPRARQQAARQAPADARLNPFWLRPETSASIGFWHDGATQVVKSRLIDFRPALVDSRLFPHEVFRRIISAQLRGLERKPLRYRSPQGNQGSYHLREAITKHAALTRAIVCSPDDLVITAGAQQAFDLLARILVVPNKTVVAIENPGYPPVRVPFSAAGAKLVPINFRWA
jgi:GntR family transcriptional regulator/MocR family aminotransferase